MSVVDRSTLINDANRIRNETQRYANTPTRVGDMLLGIIGVLPVVYPAASYSILPTNDGVTNWTNLQVAVDAINAAGGGQLTFDVGTYQFVAAGGSSYTPLTWRDKVYLRGAGMHATVLDFSGDLDYSYSYGLFVMQGTGRSNVQSVSSNVAAGALSAAVADGSGFTSGDIVQLRSTENYVVSDGGTRAEFLRVRYVSGNTVFFTTPTVEPYNTGLGTVQLAKMTFATGGASDFTVKGKGVNPIGYPTPTYTGTIEVNDGTQASRSDFFFDVRFGRDMVFERLRFLDVENQPVTLQSCFGGRVSNCNFEFSAITERSQYGITLARCTSDIRIDSNFCINNRHFVTTTHTSATGQDYFFGTPKNCTIINNIVLGSWQAGIDLHRGGANFTIVGNVVQGYYAGIKTRASKVLIADNVCWGPNATDRVSGYDGIQVQFNCSDVTVKGNKVFGHDCGIRVSSPDGDVENLVIEGNTVSECGAYGIRVTTDSFTFRRVSIDGNTVDTPVNYCIFPDGNFEDLSVSDNKTYGGNYGVRFLSAGARTGIKISDNQFRGSSNDPMYIEGCDSLTVSDNQLFGSNLNGVHLRLRNCRRGTVNANHIVIPSGSSGGNGIFLNCTGSGTCSDLVVDANEVYSPSGVGTGISFDVQSNQFHTIGDTNNCRTCATEVASSAFDPTIRNRVSAQNVTISNDIITASNGAPLVIVDTEGAAATDNLATIAYFGRIGDIIPFRQSNDSRDITFKDGTGNLRLNGDCVLTVGNDSITLQWRGTTWSEIARSING